MEAAAYVCCLFNFHELAANGFYMLTVACSAHRHHYLAHDFALISKTHVQSLTQLSFAGR